MERPAWRGAVFAADPGATARQAVADGTRALAAGPTSASASGTDPLDSLLPLAGRARCVAWLARSVGLELADDLPGALLAAAQGEAEAARHARAGDTAPFDVGVALSETRARLADSLVGGDAVAEAPPAAAAVSPGSAPGSSEPTADPVAAARVAAPSPAAAPQSAECGVCLDVLHEPVVLPCGHAVCRSCLLRTVDHVGGRAGRGATRRCPTCRSPIHVASSGPPVCGALRDLLAAAYPEAVRARAAAEANAAPATTDAAAVTLPLFVMSAALPGQRVALNIFEPRYRLLVRRCLEGGGRLGLAAATRGRMDGMEYPAGTENDDIAVFPVVTECELVEAVPQSDGRFYVELLGLRRVKVAEQWEADGLVHVRGPVLADSDADTAEAKAAARDTAELAGRVADVAAKRIARSSRGGSEPTAEEVASARARLPIPAVSALPVSNPETLGFVLCSKIVDLAQSGLLEVLRLARAGGNGEGEAPPFSLLGDRGSGFGALRALACTSAVGRLAAAREALEMVSGEERSGAGCTVQ